MFGWFIAVAFAGEEILVPFQPPDAVPLPVRAGLVAGRFPSADETCHAAHVGAIAALEDEAAAQGLPHVVRLLASADERDLSIRARCEERREGDVVVGTELELLALAVAGPDTTSWPTLSADLVAPLVWTLADLSGQSPEDVGLVAVDGQPAVRFVHDLDLGISGLDLAGRAAVVVEQHVLPELPAWTRALAPFPDVRLVEVVARVRSRNLLDRKEKRDERFRVVVDLAEAAACVRGALTEQALVRRSVVTYRPTPAADLEVPLALDLDAIEPPATRQRGSRRELDIREEDEAGLIDEGG